MGQPNYRNGFVLTLQPQMLELPLQWKKPQTIFVNSMSDLFHKDVPLAYIQRVFDVMRRAHWHRFQVLTKRADRLAELSFAIDWPTNVWMGVSVESADYVDRIDDLRTTGAHVKFLSLEPLLGPLPRLKLRSIDWVIIGGESGHRARAMDPEWVTDIRDQCRRAGVAFFFKQMGRQEQKEGGPRSRGADMGRDAKRLRGARCARALVARDGLSERRSLALRPISASKVPIEIHQSWRNPNHFDDSFRFNATEQTVARPPRVASDPHLGHGCARLAIGKRDVASGSDGELS